MATPFEVTCIQKSSTLDRITHIGGSYFRHTESDAIANIQRGIHSYYVVRGGRRVNVVVGMREGVPYLKTEADGFKPDNLLALPQCG